MTVALSAAVAAPVGVEAPAEVQAPTQTPAQERAEQIRGVSEQFEALLLQQLVGVMRSTVGEEGLFGSGAGSEMYAHLFDQGFADSMAAAGGLGMREMLERSMLGPAAYRAEMSRVLPDRPAEPFVPRTVGEAMAVRPAAGAALVGQTGRLQAVARDMLGPTGLAPQWGREGRLSEADLASDFSTEGPRGRALFNVRDAAGFQDRYKCNLFAFELARRAGFEVPLIGRTRGWGYMGPDGVTIDAAAGRLRGDWGQVATGETAESLDSGIVRGDRAFLLTATGTGDRAGHMGIVERVREVEYDDSGAIRRIVFDGWEGRTYGATHLENRVWTRQGTRNERGGRGGFDQIQIIELRRAGEGTSPERPVHPNANPSVHDLERISENFSRRPSVRPMDGLEEP